MTTMNPAAVDIAQARKALAEAEERAEAIRRQVEQQQAEQATARARRLEEFDRSAVQAVADRQEAAHREERQAREEMFAALREDPVFAAFIRHRAGRWLRTHLTDEQANLHQRLNLPGNRPNALSYRDGRLLEDLVEFCETEARRLAADEMDAYHQRREAAGNGDSA